MEPKRDEELTLRIYDIARGGAGVAKEEAGGIVFVPFTAPGDVVRAKILKREKNYAQAKLLEIIEPSSDRIKAPCPAFTRCGGCDWQHLPYEKQWNTKVDGLKHALKRMNIAFDGIEWKEFPAEQIWNYRNRVQFRGYQNQIGFFERGSKNLVSIEDCKIARHEINKAIPNFLEEGKKFTQMYKLEVQVSGDGSLQHFWNSAHGAGGFQQVHDEQNKKLQKWVKSVLVHPKTPDTSVELYDLYGGSGNLSIEIAEYFTKIYCVDVGSPEGNPPPGTPSNLHFYKSTVRPWIHKAAKHHKKNGTKSLLLERVAILDPPREGLGGDHSAISESLEILGVNKIALVGCDADSWTRDIHRFLKRGWQLTQLAALDLFPQTHHIEALAVLEMR